MENNENEFRFPDKKAKEKGRKKLLKRDCQKGITFKIEGRFDIETIAKSRFNENK